MLDCFYRRFSSVVEQRFRKAWVVGSIPTIGFYFLIKTPMDEHDFDKSMGGKAYEKVLGLVGSYYHVLLKELAQGVAGATKDVSNPLICDLGCGTGVSTGYLLSAAPKAWVLAVDVSAKMLEAVPDDLMFSLQIEWRNLDMAEALEGCPDDTFDIIANCYAVHNLPPGKRQRIFSLIARKLKKGGLFISADKIAVNDEAGHQAMLRERLAQYESLQQMGYARQSKEWIEHCKHDETIRLTESELSQSLVKLGFGVVNFGPRVGMYELAWALRD